MQLALRAIAFLSFVVAIIWMIAAPGFEPLLAFLAGISTLLVSFAVDRSKDKVETLDQRNRRVMLDHVESFWVKGVLEKSLHGAALLELGIKEDPAAVSYPWTIKEEATDEVLPQGKSILEIFQEVGMGRSLLILGAPGSGKTTMLLELARELVERARQDDYEPIPVVLNLASWTEKHTLSDWLVEQLNLIYYVPRKIAPSWINRDKMLLLLDGLDEVWEDRRWKCVEAINEFRKEHGLTSMAICCRQEEYKAIQKKLNFEGAISVQPLTANQIEEYADRFGNSLAGLRLFIAQDPILRELAETPLMLSIMALAYKDVRVEDLQLSDSLEQRRDHLFDTYTQRMFERPARSAKAIFTKEHTLHYLSWLARTMIRQNVDTYQVESMQPSLCAQQGQRILYGLCVGSITGLPIGLSCGLLCGLLGWYFFGLGLGLLFGMIVTLIVGSIFGLLGGLVDRITISDKLIWSWKNAAIGGLLGLLSVPPLALLGRLAERFIAGLSGRLAEMLIAMLVGGPFFALYLPLMCVLIGVFAGGLTSRQIQETTYPGQRLKQNLVSVLSYNLIFMLIVVLIAGLIVWPLSQSLGMRLRLIITMLFIGLPGMLLIWMSLGLIMGPIDHLFAQLYLWLGIKDYRWTPVFFSIVQHYCLRWVLAKYHVIPQQLSLFLEYCVSLAFLRRVGGGYIFVHRLLMEHFAEMYVEPMADNSTEQRKVSTFRKPG